MATGSTGGSGKRVLSEINVVPFIDVMLVLLVIFMITAPIMYHGMDVDLPRATADPIPSTAREDQVVVTLTERGEIYIQEDRYELQDVRLRVREIILDSGRDVRQEHVFLRADSSISYGKVVGVMAEIKKAGVEKLGLITEAEVQK